MTISDLRTYLLSVNNPDSAKIDGCMSCRVWSDLECTMEKGGSLLGQRNVHTIEVPHLTILLEPTLFPNIASNGYGFVFCNYEQMPIIRAALLEYLNS